jgi:hypothetical protein
MSKSTWSMIQIQDYVLFYVISEDGCSQISLG